MQSKRKVMISGVALLVSLSLLFANAPVVKSWGGDFRPLSAIAYLWNSAADITGWFHNTKSTGIGLIGYNTSTTSGQGMQGANHGTGGYGVVGYNTKNIGVMGIGGTGSADYGGLFSGYEGVRGNASGNNGWGTWGYATGSYGIGAFGGGYGSYGYGVYGYSRYYHGVRGVGGSGSGDYGGYFTGYNGVYGRGSGSYSYGLYGYAPWEGVRGVATATNGWGVFGNTTNTSSYAGVFISNKFRGLYADGASGYYDAYFPTWIRAGSTTVSSFGISLNALNAGNEALEPGDLVAFSGFVTSGEDEPTLKVEKVNGANSHAIVGVVQRAYVKEEVPAMAMHFQQAQAQEAPVGIEKEVAPIPDVMLVGEEGELGAVAMESQEEIAVAPEPAPAVEMPSEAGRMYADVERFIEGPAQPGQYVVVVIQGITRVKVDASAAPVRAGDMLVASAAGYAVNGSAASQSPEAARPREGAAESGDRARPSSELAIGRALESLETGTGSIYVFVSVR